MGKANVRNALPRAPKQGGRGATAGAAQRGNAQVPGEPADSLGQGEGAEDVGYYDLEQISREQIAEICRGVVLREYQRISAHARSRAERIEAISDLGRARLVVPNPSLEEVEQARASAREARLFREWWRAYWESKHKRKGILTAAREGRL